MVSGRSDGSLDASCVLVRELKTSKNRLLPRRIIQKTSVVWIEMNTAEGSDEPDGAGHPANDGRE